MFYRMTDDYALRSWKFVDRVLLRRFEAAPTKVDAATFDVLLACDGEHDLPESDTLARLREAGVVAPCAKGDRPGEWSSYRRYDHRYVPAMNLMLTGRCNYNCRHCFNAAENADRMAEWSWEDLFDLLDQAADCGFHSIALTGGEPLLYPRFLDVVREIYRRNMVLEKINTNGHYLTGEMLDELSHLNCHPQMKISFDGVGYHDWMRNHAGAEEHALSAFRLCHDKGFQTLAQVQVFRRNLGVLRDTLHVLEDVGVQAARLIRTTEATRWQREAPGESLGMEEYFEEMLDLADWYLRGDHAMNVVMWMFLKLLPALGLYSMVPVKDRGGACRPTWPVCRDNRTMMAVTCEGYVVPCMQAGGYLVERGYAPESLRERRLRDILRGGRWLDEVCTNLYALRQANTACDSCPWFGFCGGGCRALALFGSYEGSGRLDYFASDPMACLFFKGGWYDRVRDRLSYFGEF